MARILHSRPALGITLIGFLLWIQNGAAVTPVTPGCPAHLSEVEGGHTAVHEHVCYLFVDRELYWKRARRECYQLGGEMLSVEDAQTMTFIAGTLDSRELGWDRKGVWLGARHVSGAWRWTNGREMSYENWADGEPSQVLKRLGFEDCVQMRKDARWRWHDYPCGALKFHYNFICQFPLSKPSDTEGQVAPSAAEQEENNGNSSTLIIIIGLGVSLLLLMLVIALLLNVHHRRTKRLQAERPVHFSNNNNNHHHNLHSNNTSGSGGSGSNGHSVPSSGSLASQTCPIAPPSGRPPLPPSGSRGQQNEAAMPFLYSEVSKPRTPHLQMISFPAKKGQQQSPHTQSVASPATLAAGANGATLAYSAAAGLAGAHGPSPLSASSQRLRGTDSDLELDLERAPLMMTPSTSGDPLLEPSAENSGSASYTPPPSFSTAVGGAAMAETHGQQQQPLSGDYVDMNSLICKENHRGQGQAKVKGEGEAPDEDKHTYTNVDHREEKAENLYEVLP